MQANGVDLSLLLNPNDNLTNITLTTPFIQGMASLFSDTDGFAQLVNDQSVLKNSGPSWPPQSRPAPPSQLPPTLSRLAPPPPNPNRRRSFTTC